MKSVREMRCKANCARDMGETAVKIPMPSKEEKEEIVKYIAAKTKKTVKLS